MNRLSAMEAFVSLVETGSFSAAGQRLGIGQPAVSKAISQLEESLGVRLLFRSTHGLSPTEAGKSFYVHAKRAIDEVEKAESAARGAATKLVGQLRVGAPVTFARLHIIPHLQTLLDQHPALEVEMILDDRNIDLIEAGIDIAFRMGALADSSLIARRIGQGRRLVLASPVYFSKSGRPAAPSDLESHLAVIYRRESGGAVWKFSKGSTECNVNLKGRFHCNAAEGIREAVLSGLGLTVSSEWMFAPELASQQVSAVLDDWMLPPIELWAITPTGRQVSAKARSFASFVESQVSGPRCYPQQENGTAAESG